MAAVRKASPAHRRHAAVLRRDGALARISVITAAIGVGTITAVGMLGVYVAKALPGPSPNGNDRCDDAIGQQRSGHRQFRTQSAVVTHPGSLTARSGDQRIELMAKADADSSLHCVYRTRALGTTAELVVTDRTALVAASELLVEELERIDLRGEPIP